MRLGAIFAFTLMLSGPAAAASIADQAHAAYAAFAGGLSASDFLAAQYSLGLLRDIDGNWAKLSGPDNKTGAESYGPDTDRICGTDQAVALASLGPATMAMTTKTPRGSFTQSYTLIAGTTFGEHVETVPYLDAIGLGFDRAGDAAAQQRALALSVVNGVVQIYRPSPDIVVLTRDRGYPLILARCPKS